MADSYTTPHVSKEQEQMFVDFLRRRYISQALTKLNSGQLHDLEKHVRGIMAAIDEAREPGEFHPKPLPDGTSEE